MKKSIKVLRIVPLVLLTVFVLSGCVSLQTLKKEHAIYKDSTKKTIIWNGNEYQYLINNESSYFYVDINENITLDLTDSDVPTLLKAPLGDYVEVSKDESMLCVYTDVYCLKEKYDELKTRLEGGSKREFYACQYQSWIEDDEEMSSTLLHIFTEEEKKLLEEIEKNSVEKKMYVDWDKCDYIGEMYLVSKDGLFREYREVDLYKTNKGEYFWEKFEDYDYKIYAIPKEYNDSIENLFEEEIKVAQKYAEYMEEYYEE